LPKPAIKLREPKVELPPRQLRVTVPGEVFFDLDAYCALYSDIHTRPIALPALVTAILVQFLESDREFQKWKQAREAAIPESRGGA
jgi:hypothetical protein